MVESMSVRGGILDVFPPSRAKPVRVEFFGDQIESMRRFEVARSGRCSRRGGAAAAVARVPEVRASVRGAARAKRGRGLDCRGAVSGWELMVPLARREAVRCWGCDSAGCPVGRARNSCAARPAALETVGGFRAAVAGPSGPGLPALGGTRGTGGGGGPGGLRELAWRGGRVAGRRRAATMSFKANRGVAEARAVVGQGGRVVCFAASTGNWSAGGDLSGTPSFTSTPG